MRRFASNLENKSKRDNSPKPLFDQQKRSQSPSMVYTKDDEEEGIYKNNNIGMTCQDQTDFTTGENTAPYAYVTQRKYAKEQNKSKDLGSKNATNSHLLADYAHKTRRVSKQVVDHAHDPYFIDQESKNSVNDDDGSSKNSANFNGFQFRS